MKLVNIEQENLHIFWTTREISMKFLGKVWLTKIFKVWKITFIWKINVWKNHSGGQIDSPAFFELKTSSKFKWEKFFTRGSHAFQEKGGVWGSVSVCVWVCFCVCVSCVEEGILKGGKRKSIEITPLFYMCSAK